MLKILLHCAGFPRAGEQFLERGGRAAQSPAPRALPVAAPARRPPLVQPAVARGVRAHDIDAATMAANQKMLKYRTTDNDTMYATVKLNEFLALKDIYDSTNGTHWAWNPEEGLAWDFSNISSSNPCKDQWQGVLCYFHQCGDDGCNIFYLNLTSMNLDGTLPSLDHKFPKLALLDTAENHLRGHVPSMRGMPDLQLLNMSHNAFTGQLPDTFSEMSQLYLLYFSGNLLSGTLPPSLYQLSSLQYLNFYDNSLHGSISDEIGNLKELLYLSLSGNYLTGTIPPSIFSLPSLGKLLLGTNQFHGSLPHDLGSSLELLRLCDAHLTGTLSATICNSTKLSLVSVMNNMLSGTLPKCMSQMRHLEVLQLQENKFHGPTDELFNRTVQTTLNVVDISGNAFSGEFPAELLKLPRLSSVAAGKNCFHGTIPECICNAGGPFLQTVALDGLASSTSCVKKLWDPFGVSNTDFGGVMSGSIPECLWSLPNITVLHLSGNGLTGTLPSEHVCGQGFCGLSPSLQDVVLTHNKLKGTIPVEFQMFPFDSLDLSFNKLRGNLGYMQNQTLARSPDGPGVALHLEDNRLSGQLPRAFEDAYRIDVLQGNLFSCHADRSQLAKHDPGSDTSICGSQELDGSLATLWVALLISVGVALLGMAIHYFHKRNFRTVRRVLRAVQFAIEYSHRAAGLPVPTAAEMKALKNLQYRMTSTEALESPQFYNIHQFLATLTLIRKLAVVVAAYGLLVCMPTYITFYHWGDGEYSMHDDSYSWVSTVAYLSGEVPAVVLFVQWTVLLLLVVHLIVRHYNLHSADDAGLVANIVKALTAASAKIRGSFKDRPSFAKAYRPLLDDETDPISGTERCSDHSAPTATGSSETDSTWRNTLFQSLKIDRVSELVRSEKIRETVKFSGLCVAICLVNMTVTLAMNAAYLVAENDENVRYSVKMALQALMATFKIFWNVFALRVFMSQLPCRRSTVVFHVGLLVFNSILAPCIATALTDNACFQEVFVAPRSILVQYDFVTCLESYQEYDYEHDQINNVCTHYEDTTFDTTFTPTFIYYYTCGSKLLTLYTPVFIYIYTIILFLLPLLYLGLAALQSATWSSALLRHIDGVVRPQDRAKIYFFKLARPYATQAMLVHHLIVLLTFGVASPVLAAIMAAALSVDTLMWQVILTRYITYDSVDSPFSPGFEAAQELAARDPRVEDRSQVFVRSPLECTFASSNCSESGGPPLVSVASDDVVCRLLRAEHRGSGVTGRGSSSSNSSGGSGGGIAGKYSDREKEEARLYELHTVCCEAWKSVRSTMWLVVYCAVFFYCCVLFDIVGDDKTWAHALWVPVAGVAFLLLVRGCFVDGLRWVYSQLGEYRYRDVQDEDGDAVEIGET